MHLDKTLLAFALLHFIFQGQTCLVSEYLLTSCFCIPVPYDENDIFFGISSGKFCVLRVPECACSVVSDSLRSPGLASLSAQFSRQEYWSRSLCPTPENLPDPGIKPMSPSPPALESRFLTTESPGKPLRAHGDALNSLLHRV